MFKSRWSKVIEKVFMVNGLEGELAAFMGEGTDGGSNDVSEENDSAEDTEGVEGTEEDSDEEDVAEDSEEEEDEETDESDSDSDESDDDPDIAAEIKSLQEQNKTLLELLKKKADVEPEEEEVIAPSIDLLESERFTDLVAAFDWDESEADSFKSFLKSYGEQVSEAALSGFKSVAPEMMTNTMKTQNELSTIRDTFYKENPALAEIKPYIAQIASQVAKEKGEGVSISEVLKLTAEKAYSAMGIDKSKAGKVSNKAEKGKKPAFPKAKGVRKKAPVKTKLDSEFDAMLALME